MVLAEFWSRAVEGASMFPSALVSRRINHRPDSIWCSFLDDKVQSLLNIFGVAWWKLVFQRKEYKYLVPKTDEMPWFPCLKSNAEPSNAHAEFKHQSSGIYLMIFFIIFTLTPPLICWLIFFILIHWLNVTLQYKNMRPSSARYASVSEYLSPNARFWSQNLHILRIPLQELLSLILIESYPPSLAFYQFPQGFCCLLKINPQNYAIKFLTPN